MELLAGHEVPKNLPTTITRVLAIGDTGCARSMANHPDQMKKGSIYEHESQVSGVAGKLSVKHRGEMAYPIETNVGFRVWAEKESILNKACAYLLLALGRASREQGLALDMPAWGGNCKATYPNGVFITLLNRDVLVLRPLGYKESPSKPMPTLTSVATVARGETLGIPDDHDFVLYIGSGPRRHDDLTSACLNLGVDAEIVLLDPLIGGTQHDATNPGFKDAVIKAVTPTDKRRCVGALFAIRCKTWSVANFLKDAHGNPGKLWRDIDHLLGIPRDGSLPKDVMDANSESMHAVQIALAVVQHGGFVISEGPARRTGPKAWPSHVLPDCTRAVHMNDHPAWQVFIDRTDAVELVWDQCTKSDKPGESPIKSTIWLCTPNIVEPMIAEFGEPPTSLCDHPPGTHKALRGVDNKGKYVTASSKCENYSGKTNVSLAVAIKWFCDKYKMDTTALATASGVQPLLICDGCFVAGVTQGKVLAKHAVNHGFIHNSFNHSEARVLKFLHHALADIGPWWADMIEDKPCDACLQGNSKKIGATGSLPNDPGLLYLDIHHVTVPEMFTGFTTTVGCTHAASGFTKSARVKGKGDAHLAIELFLAYFNSIGIIIVWLHADNANELKGTRMVIMARAKNIRITTTTVDSSRKNRQEPQWAAEWSVTRRLMQQGKGVYNLWGYANDEAQEGRNLIPSRDPPHDCALGRLLAMGTSKAKPTGGHRRPWLCMCYVTDAPRLPSGTLVNKVASQAKRALHLGYIGGRAGSFERVGIDHTQAGYACFVPMPDPGKSYITVSSDVRHVPSCFPGLGRTSRGGWEIPESGISFLHDGGDKTKEADEAEPIKEITTDADLDGLAEQDGGSLDLIRGFPPDTDGVMAGRGGLETNDAPQPTDGTGGRGGTDTDTDDVAAGRGGRETDDAQRPTPAPVVRYLVPSEHWPDYECTEHDGRGWEVQIIKRARQWAYCKFVTATDTNGLAYPNEWRRISDLIQVQGTTDPAPQVVVEPQAAPVPVPPTAPVARTTADAIGTGGSEFMRGLRADIERRDRERQEQERAHLNEPIPNENVRPAPGATDQYRDTVRPVRARRPVDRLDYSALALGAVQAECAATNYDLHSPRLPDSAFVVDVSHGADRLVTEAFDLYDSRNEILMLADENHIRSTFDQAAEEMQRAALIAADVTRASDEFGSTAPQTKMLRELYAVAAFDAASHGVRVPYLEPMLTVDAGAEPGAVLTMDEIFEDQHSGSLLLCAGSLLNSVDTAELFMLAKAKSSPDDYNERQMSGPEWDTPKQLEVAKINRLNAKTDIAADDPSIKGMPVNEFTWVGRHKRNPDGSTLKMNARAAARGDLDKGNSTLTANDKTSPVARTSSNLCHDAVGVLRAQHKCDYDVPGAYLQGDQRKSEQRLYRPPKGFRSWDERGVEILWLSNNPFYGQTDAGAIWNRTINTTFTSNEPPDGCGLTRCPQDPCVYATNVAANDASRSTEGQVNNTLYVDDGRLAWDPDDAAKGKVRDIKGKLTEKYGIEFGADDPPETHFLGSNILTHASRKVASVRAYSYIDKMVNQYAGGDVSPCKRFPAHWSSTPADEVLVRAYEAAVATRTPASPELTKRFGSLFGALLHAVKFRPEIAAALQLLGSCLTFPTEELYECAMHVLVYLGRNKNLGATFSAHGTDAGKVKVYADSNWNITRSVTGFVILLAGAYIVAVCRRQHCITMSSCEAELIALCDAAIELIHTLDVVNFLGHATPEAIEVNTDSKAAYDLCHRFTSAQNSRHIDRKLFKMRELRGAGLVVVNHIPGVTNPADLFTKILSKQEFEKHRKVVLNLPGDTGVEHARREAVAGRSAPSQRDGTGAT